MSIDDAEKVRILRSAVSAAYGLTCALSLPEAQDRSDVATARRQLLTALTRTRDPE